LALAGRFGPAWSIDDAIGGDDLLAEPVEVNGLVSSPWALVGCPTPR